MTARILVVDDVPANVRLLEAKLTAEYFEVVTALDGPSALEAVAAHSAVRAIHYPGLPDHPGAHIAARQMTLPGAMLSLEIDGDHLS